MLLTAVSLTGCAEPQAVGNQNSKNQGLLSSPDQIDLGTIQPGGKAQATFVLQNLTGASVEIDQITTSCDCLHIFPQTKHVQPGKQVRAVVQVDFSHDSEFQGGLAIDAEGRTHSGQVAFKLMVKVTVR